MQLAGFVRKGIGRLLLTLLALTPTLTPSLRAEELRVDRDDRSFELLDYSCTSAAGEHHLTLFANGTLRLREGVDRDGDRRMVLVELTRDELDDYVAQLRTKVYDRTHRSVEGGPSGEWVEQCRLLIAVEAGEPVEYRFSPIDSGSLDLHHSLSIAKELLAEARKRSRSSEFPVDYEPRRGDILIRADGSRFRVERFTSDGRGVEISGIDQPLVIYVEASQVTGEFIGLVRREERR